MNNFHWLSVLTCVFLVLIVALLIFYIYTLLKADDNIEKYESPSDDKLQRQYDRMSKIVLAFLKDNGYTDLEDLKKFVQGQYNESLDDIYEDHTLTLYYSAFSKGSYTSDEDSKQWMNISPYLKKEKETNPNNSQILPYDKSHISASDESPYVQRRDGVSLRDQMLIGPPSHLLGIKGNASFTIFMVCRFNRFNKPDKPDKPDKPGEHHELLKLYGNTDQNNGLLLTLEPQAHEKDAQIISVKWALQFGADPPLESAGSARNAKEGDKMLRLNITKPYMFVVKKELKEISLTVHDMSTDASSDAIQVAIPATDVQDNNVLLSNKELRINQNKMIDGVLFAFGVYNEALTDVSNLHHHLFKELDKRTDDFMDKARLMVAFQQELEQMRACPFDVNICRECADVDDWTNINEIVLSSDKCKKAIDEYCTANPNDSKCICWSEDKLKEPNCRAFVNIFRRDKHSMIENLTDEQIEVIKEKYKLCKCEEVEQMRLKEQKKEQEEQREREKEVASYKLSSSHIPSRDIEDRRDKDSAFISPDTIEPKKSLLKHLPEEALPEVNSRTMNRLAQKTRGYKGDEDDVSHFNRTLNQTYGDPSSPILKNDDEFDYGAKEINPNRSFWGWLFGGG